MRRLLRQLRQLLLQQQARQDHDHRRHRSDPRQLRGDDRQDNHKQDKKRQIDDGGDGGGGDHLADLLQLAQLGDKAAGGSRNGAVAQPQRVAEHPIRDAQIRAFAQQIHNVSARHAQHKAKQRGDQHPDSQHIERRIGLGGDHPVIHLHGKDDAREGEHVNEQCSQHHPAVRAKVAHHQPVEPVRAVF